MLSMALTGVVVVAAGWAVMEGAVGGTGAGRDSRSLRGGGAASNG